MAQCQAQVGARSILIPIPCQTMSPVFSAPLRLVTGVLHITVSNINCAFLCARFCSKPFPEITQSIFPLIMCRRYCYYPRQKVCALQGPSGLLLWLHTFLQGEDSAGSKGCAHPEPAHSSTPDWVPDYQPLSPSVCLRVERSAGVHP